MRVPQMPSQLLGTSMSRLVIMAVHCIHAASKLFSTVSKLSQPGPKSGARRLLIMLLLYAMFVSSSGERADVLGSPRRQKQGLTHHACQQIPLCRPAPSQTSSCRAVKQAYLRAVKRACENGSTT